MATGQRGETVPYSQPVDRERISKAALAGVIGGVAFGLAIRFLGGEMASVGALYVGGSGDVTVGWVAHLFHSTVFGAVFGLLTQEESLHDSTATSIVTAVSIAIAFALVLYAVAVGFIWPTWLIAVSYPPAATYSVPHFPPQQLLGHLVWGIITGAVFHVLVDD